MYYRIINRKKLIATILADKLGALCLRSAARPVADIQPDTIREILVIRTAYIGDVLMTLPILKPLKTLYPQARITFLTSASARELVAKNPFVDRVLTYDAFWFYAGAGGLRRYWEFRRELRACTYDLVIEARADIRDILLLAHPARSRFRVSYAVGGGGYLLTHVVPFEKTKHRVDYHLDIVRFLGANTDALDWGLEPGASDQAAAITMLRAHGIDDSRRLIGIHPGARMVLKQWPIARFGEIAQRLVTEYGVTICFTGSAQERPAIDRIIGESGRMMVNLGGDTPWPILGALMRRLELFLCNDTGPLHMASGLGIPTVVIFGPSKSNETGPYRNRAVVVEKDFPCRATCDEARCRHQAYNACLQAISCEEVMNGVYQLLPRPKGGGVGKIP